LSPGVKRLGYLTRASFIITAIEEGKIVDVISGDDEDFDPKTPSHIDSLPGKIKYLQ